jgi:hypothetical protein
VHTWIGLAIMVAGQAGLAADSQLMATWLTPVMWTGDILFLDGLIYRLRGRSWLVNRRREFPLLVLLSVAVWLVFEAYNLHMHNWEYAGLPADPRVRDFGYFWSFATIMPGVFLSAEIFESMLERLRLGVLSQPARIGPSWAWSLLGLAMITVPLAIRSWIAAYLFGLVWIGFFLVLDPLNEMLGVPSIRQRWQLGDRRKAYSLVLGGLICGLVWETWNQQAATAGGAFWVYTFPSELSPFDLRFGQMPVLGLLGFPPFALELYAFFQLLRKMLGGDRVFGSQPADA